MKIFFQKHIITNYYALYYVEIDILQKNVLKYILVREYNANKWLLHVRWTKITNEIDKFNGFNIEINV